jgi:hypothetical protein
MNIIYSIAILKVEQKLFYSAPKNGSKTIISKSVTDTHTLQDPGLLLCKMALKWVPI